MTLPELDSWYSIFQIFCQIIQCLNLSKDPHKFEALSKISLHVDVYGDDLLACHSNPTLENHPLSGFHTAKPIYSKLSFKSKGHPAFPQP